MTKEKLEQEAVQYAEELFPNDVFKQSAVIQAIMKFAEPKEKRIAELEKENVDILKNTASLMRNAEMLRDSMENKIKKLEEENAELEKQHKIEKEKWYAEYTAMYSDFQKHIEELEKEKAELKEHHKNVCENLTDTHRNIREQLTKAKEIIEDLIKFQPYINKETMFTSLGNEWKTAIYKAKQFLKENE